MTESHAAGWASDAPTPAQMKEFFAQIESQRVTKQRLQDFLRGDTVPFPTLETFREAINRLERRQGGFSGEFEQIACVLRLFHGLEDGKEYSLEEIAAMYHYTSERIRQIEAQGRRMLGIYGLTLNKKLIRKLRTG